MDNMYEHHEDPFGEYMDEITGTPSITVNLPIGETLVVNGPRQTPTIITVSNKAERNPKRDARMLAATLSCSLDEQTVFHLAEYLFSEHIAPIMQDRQNLSAAQQRVINTPPPPPTRPKRAPKKVDDNKD